MEKESHPHRLFGLFLSVTLSGVLTFGTPEPVLTADKDGMCWRGRPYRECRYFMITEFGLEWRLNEATDPIRADEVFPHSAVYELGPMFNFKEKMALGGTVSARFRAEAHLDLNARLRWWIGDRWALDFSSGIILFGSSNDDDYGLLYPSVSGRLCLNYGDWFGFTCGAELARIRNTGSEVDWFAGAHIGYYPGVVMGALFIVLGVLSTFAVAVPAT